MNWKDLFAFSAGEKRAVILLATAILFLLLFRAFLPRLVPVQRSFSSKLEEDIRRHYEQKESQRIQDVEENPIRAFKQDYIQAYEDEFQREMSEDALLPTISVELNRADSTSLVSLKGIGPVYAGRIIRYRDLLGGYSSVEQLLEVYGIDTTLYNQIEKFIEVNADAVTPLNLNSASFKTLLRHPYMDINQVKAIMHYRNFKSIDDLQDLVENRIFSEKEMSRLRYYLSLN